MNLSIGIVGMPNVGKSTLFNALLKKQSAFVANYPFATIEPNIGVVPVPDERLKKLTEITQAEHKMSALPPILPATVSFVDIAGLVKGAAQGEGLGNKFLSHIREVSLIAHVVRAFEDENVVREGSKNAKDDYQVINTELILADLETLNKQSEPRKNVTKEDLHRWEAVKKLKTELDKGFAARFVPLTKEEEYSIQDLHLITMKPEIIILNVSEEFNFISGKEPILINSLEGEDESYIYISAKLENELVSLSEDEQKEYLRDLGLPYSGLERLIKKSYDKLGLISFLTCGEKEVRAWTIKKDSTALNAAGEIHTDFMKKFIKAEVVHYSDFVANNGWKGSREHGKALLEGKDYVMQDGDVTEFKIGS